MVVVRQGGFHPERIFLSIEADLPGKVNFEDIRGG
jgi:hypothetical protein